MSLKILVVTNMFSESSSSYRPYIKQQIKSLKDKNIEVEKINLRKFNFPLLNLLLGMVNILIKTTGRKYDLIHAHYGFNGTSSILRYKTPLITTFHGSDIHVKWQRMISKIPHRLGSESIFVSKNLFNLMGSKKGIVIPCGVDLDIFKPLPKEEVRKELKIPLDKRIIAFSGNKDAIAKNYPLFKKTLEKLDRNDNKEYYLWGYSQEMVVKILNAADVLLMTSINEGSPVIIKEAIACNLPVVSVDVGDVKEVIGNIPGCYIGNYDPKELAQYVEKAINNKNFEGRKYITSYDNNLIAERLIEVYKKVLGES